MNKPILSANERAALERVKAGYVIDPQMLKHLCAAELAVIPTGIPYVSKKGLEAMGLRRSPFGR